MASPADQFQFPKTIERDEFFALYLGLLPGAGARRRHGAASVMYVREYFETAQTNAGRVRRR